MPKYFYTGSVESAPIKKLKLPYLCNEILNIYQCLINVMLNKVAQNICFEIISGVLKCQHC